MVLVMDSKFKVGDVVECVPVDEGAIGRVSGVIFISAMSWIIGRWGVVTRVDDDNSCQVEFAGQVDVCRYWLSCDWLKLSTEEPPVLTYWYVTEFGEVEKVVCEDIVSLHRQRLDAGNYFVEKKDAECCAAIFRMLLSYSRRK